MSLKIVENISLAELTTMKIGGTARYFTEITSSLQLPEVFDWASKRSLPFLILGGGSNTIFDNGTFKGIVIRIDIKGFEILEDDNS